MDYFSNNLKESKSSAIDKNAGGFVKQKVKLEVGKNGNSLLGGNNSESISYEWMFWDVESQAPG